MKISKAERATKYLNISKNDKFRSQFQLAFFIPISSSTKNCLLIADGDVKNNLGIVMKELEQYIVVEYGVEPPRPSDTPPWEGN